LKAVFLDFATLGAERLDPTPLYDVLPDIELFDATDESAVADRIRHAEYVLVNKVRLPGTVLAEASRLRYVGVAATGTDNVDLDHAAANDIAVSSIRGYCTQSVVEHVFAVILTLAHNLVRYRNDVGAGAWQQATGFCLLDHPIRQLSAMTLGVVGYGELGRAVARVAEAFGMDVLVSARAGEKDDAGDHRPSFEKVLRLADVLTLHCPLTDATRGMIGERELALMKTDALLVNTARGALVDPSALIEALESNRLGGAAVDVLEQEPPVDGNPLLDYQGDNLILTPHIAWATETARQNAIVEMAANIRSFQDGLRRGRIV